MRRVLAAVTCALAAAPVAAAAPAAAAGPAATAKSLARQMGSAGSKASAVVVDLDSGRTLYARRPNARRIPASNEKLYTTASALLTLGPDAHPDTVALATDEIGIDGVIDGDLYLRGGGDPTLSADGLRSLATAVVASGVTEVTGHVVGDESLYDRVRGTAATGFGASIDLSPLGALMVDRGRTGSLRPYYQGNPPAFAASALAAALRARGVRVAKAGRTGRAPAGALTVATLRAPTFAALARAANVPSDNTIAESLLKAVGAADATPATTRNGAAVAKATLRERFGIAPRIADGSGLSRRNRTSPRQLVELLTGIRTTEAWPSFYDSLAVAGRSGTLGGRLRWSVARGRCRGKTGTLRDVSALSGYCTTRAGRTLAFSILMNRVNPAGARTLQDRMVDAIARYAA